MVATQKIPEPVTVTLFGKQVCIDLIKGSGDVIALDYSSGT
jgi:hypothetical protein